MPMSYQFASFNGLWFPGFKKKQNAKICFSVKKPSVRRFIGQIVEATQAAELFSAFPDGL